MLPSALAYSLFLPLLPLCSVRFLQSKWIDFVFQHTGLHLPLMELSVLSHLQDPGGSNIIRSRLLTSFQITHFLHNRMLGRHRLKGNFTFL